MAKAAKWIRDAEIVMSDEVMRGHVYVEDGTIQAIDTNAPFKAAAATDVTVIDGSGYLLMPGMIDLHSDAIEKEAEPRPNTILPLALSLYELEKKLAAAGVTMIYHSLSIGTGLSLRGDHLMQQLVELINQYKQEASLIRHRIHLRYEVTHFAGLDIAEQLVQANKVDYFSYMNHAPGIGQYSRPGSFEAYVMKRQGVDEGEVQTIVDALMEKQTKIDWQRIQALTELVRQQGICIASHDDDSPTLLDTSRAMGATVSEFPLNLETATYARQQQMDVCVGAPNLIRGGSHDQNLSAIDAIKSGAANIICSDYAPSLLLPSIFKLIDEGIALPEAVNMVSLNPAKALGLADQYGSIEVGKNADLLLVDQQQHPSVRLMLVNGHIVFESQRYKHD